MRPERGERLLNNVEKYSHVIHPHASGEVRGGPGQRSGEGSQSRPNDLLFNTEPGHAKFPAVVGFLDREVAKRLAEDTNPGREDSTAWKCGAQNSKDPGDDAERVPSVPVAGSRPTTPLKVSHAA